MKGQKKNFEKKENAITLIALVISIIVLLILAGVSMSAIIGDNGILKEAERASEESYITSEKEALEKIIVLENTAKIENPNEINKYYIGEELKDRKLTNGNSWKIVVINESQEVYGTEWAIIEKGTELIDYGESRYSWLVNYETGEKIRLEEGEYTKLDYTKSVAITEGLIFFLDSQVLYAGEENLTEEEYESYLGEEVDLKGFETDEETGYLKQTAESGASATTFNFDGENDHINILYDDQESLNKLYENGLTFEYYGTVESGVHFDAINDKIIENYEYNYSRNIWIMEWQ